MTFLTYMARSGSTLVAKLLSEVAGLTVSLEAKIPDDLKYGSIDVKEPRELPNLIDRLYSDPKFCAWGIERRTLFCKLASQPLPLRFNSLLNVIASLVCSSAESEFVYKCQHYISYIDRLLELFPGCKFIFVMRDPRAIYNSQKKAINTATHEPMNCSNPTRTIVAYKKIAGVLRKRRNEECLHVVKYEDLLFQPEKEIDRVLSFLGVSNEANRELGKSYISKIPLPQKHLHENVQHKPLRERAEAWQTELSSLETSFFNTSLSKELIEHDYSTDGMPSKHAPVRHILCQLAYCRSMAHVWLSDSIEKILKRGARA